MSRRSKASSSSLAGTNMSLLLYCLALNIAALDLSCCIFIGVYVDEHTPLNRTSANWRANVCITECESEQRGQR